MADKNGSGGAWRGWRPGRAPLTRRDLASGPRPLLRAHRCPAAIGAWTINSCAGPGGAEAPGPPAQPGHRGVTSTQDRGGNRPLARGRHLGPGVPARSRRPVAPAGRRWAGPGAADRRVPTKASPRSEGEGPSERRGTIRAVSSAGPRPRVVVVVVFVAAAAVAAAAAGALLPGSPLSLCSTPRLA